MALIHTAELASVNPFDYLTALLTHIDLAVHEPGRWMPWNYAAALTQLGPAVK